MGNLSTEAAAAAAAAAEGERLSASKNSRRSSLETNQGELLIKLESVEYNYGNTIKETR